MNRYLSLGGVVASVILIAFGITSIVVGIDGRGRVQYDLAREKIVGTPDSEIPNQLVDTAYFAESVSTFVIVMGVAMLLTGIGFLVLTLTTRRREGPADAAS